MDIKTLLYKRPFDADPYLPAIEAKVISCEKLGDNYAVILDRTIFFPRGGGQPCEGGDIDGLPVLDVYEEDGEILHIINSPLTAGRSVTLNINMDKRLEHMRYHLAQHILSAVLTKLFHDDTLTARIEEAGGHIELPCELTPEQLAMAEEEANSVIARNLSVKTDYHTPDEVKNYDVRGRVTPHEFIRLVHIEGFDINACGGTHCRSTGEIIRVVITGAKRVRGVFRVYYKAGLPALEELKGRTAGIVAIQESLGCETLDEARKAAAKSVAERASLEEQNRLLKARLLESDYIRLRQQLEDINGVPFISAMTAGEAKHFKQAADRLTRDDGAVVLLGVEEGGNISFIFQRPKGPKAPDLGGYLKQVMAELGGKGGGSPVTAQGMAPMSEKAEKIFVSVSEKIKEELQ